MSEGWLQLSAGVLLIAWCFVMARAISHKKKADTQPSINRNNEAAPEAATEQAPLFSRWKEIITEGREKCEIILESRKWSQDISAYHNFKSFCSDYQVTIVNEEKLDWLVSKPRVYFDDPALIPFLWENGYYLQVVKGRTLKDLLEQASPFSLIIISVKDDGSQSLNHKWQEELTPYGIRCLTREHLRNSYLCLIWKRNDREYQNLYEGISSDQLMLTLKSGDRIKGFNIPFNLDAISAGLQSGNQSSIRINDREYSLNMRGMNIVEYDLVGEIVKTVHRVDTFVTIYEDTTLYRASPEAETNAS